MTGMPALCNHCGRQKPADGFRACPECRAEWRRNARKPGGTAEKLEAASDAIAYLLNRSLRDDKLYYHIGFGTEAFRRLTKAHALLAGETLADVEVRYAR